MNHRGRGFRPRPRPRWLLPRLLALVLCACSAPAAAQGGAPEIPRRVLLIGNSFTYWNQLPAMLQAMGDSAGIRGWHVESVTYPGVSLEDHWQIGTAMVEIGRGGWDLVVMQQGPSSQLSSRAVLLDYATRFSVEIRRIGGRPGFYMVWPSQDRPRDFDGVTASYTAAADSLDGMLFPAGEAWRAVWRRDPSLTLYSADRLHPAQLGSYVVALIIIAEVTGRSPVGLPSRLTVSGPAGYTLDVPAATARLVQQAAEEAIRRFGRR